MAFTVCASSHEKWEQNSLEDFADFSDKIEWRNQEEIGDGGGRGEWFYIPEEKLPPMKGVDYERKEPNERVIYFGTYGNDNSPGADAYTYAEIFDMDDPEDAEEFEKRSQEWENDPEYLDYSDISNIDPDEEDEEDEDE